MKLWSQRTLEDTRGKFEGRFVFDRMISEQMAFTGQITTQMSAKLSHKAVTSIPVTVKEISIFRVIRALCQS